MWRLPRLRDAAGGTMAMTTTTITTTSVIKNRRVWASFWCPELNADATTRGW
jgi:hypothetical protein